MTIDAPEDPPRDDLPEPDEGAPETGEHRPHHRRTTLDDEPGAPADPLVREEEERAAAEARALGGRAPNYEVDEAWRPLEEAGEGEAEGFEEAEKELREAAQHEDDSRSPEVDRFSPEKEADRATAAYGEPDEVDPTEVVIDPDEAEDDPGAGPGIAADR
jgi:hypothetical protein